MVTVKDGSHVYQLLQLLAIAGEFPASSLHLLGSERSVKDLVHRLESAQDIRFPPDESVLRTKMFTVSGYREMRTVRLSKGALPLLEGLYPEASDYYMRMTHNHNFSGGVHHVGRNHRVGEAIAMAMMAGLEFQPYMLPKLQSGTIARKAFPKPSFYIARDIKGSEFDDMDKTMFTRVVGAMFYPGGCYAVYNTRNAVMKWSGTGEFKAKHFLSGLNRCNNSSNDVESALLLGNDPAVALQTILESDKTKNLRKSSRFDKTYRCVHFVPLNSDGIQLLKLLTLPDWNERVLDALFERECRSWNQGFMEYDAVVNGVYVFSHLDSDLARLIRFREGLRFEEKGLPWRTETERQFEVVCYPWQAEFLKVYLGGIPRLRFRAIPMEKLLKGMGLCN